MIINGDTFAHVYEALLKTLYTTPEFKTSPRDENINEITNAVLKIGNPYAALYKNKRRSSQQRYIVGELLWYLTGDNNVDFISQFSNFWQKIKNDDGTLNSAYGHLIFKERYNQTCYTQWQWAYKSLVEDKDTRQAILHFNKPEHQFTGNKDFVCTMFGNFMIRDNKLLFTVDMRSNDAILGLPTDIPFFCLLQINMWNLLKKTYPDLELGTYTHIVQSMHIYERNFELVSEMLKEQFFPKFLLPGCETLIDERGNTTDFIKSTKQLVINNSTNPKYPETSFNKWINEKLFEK